jgi:hypothetical protein
MQLRRVNQPPSFEPMVGIVRFEMEDDGRIVHCMVSEWALRGRAAIAQDLEPNVERLFERYRSEVETLAAKQYASGEQHPMVIAEDLAPPPSLPKAAATGDGP